MKEIACFISPHGFGHATRTIAVLQALQDHTPDIHPHIFTTVPESLFAETLTGYSYHSVQTDIGLMQKSAMEIDIRATLKKLSGFLPFSKKLLQQQASLCSTCSVVLCDISPLGIAVAQEMGVPSVLVENFTWDWIYKPFRELTFYARLLRQEFSNATYRIQTKPLCQDNPRDLLCGPIFRRFRKSKTALRKKLGAGSRKVVVITSGGIGQKLPIRKEMTEMTEYLFVILGQPRKGKAGENILLMENPTPYYHPDLINCADLVVCKAGYSTIAECFQAGVRVITVGREDFPESKILMDFLQENMSGIAIDKAALFSGEWIHRIEDVLTLPLAPPAPENGAEKVASFINPLL